MEIGTSENFSHGQIGSNSQNYGGSAGSRSIHNGNNFGQMNTNGYGSSQITNARPMSMSGKSIQSNMRSMVGTSLKSSHHASHVTLNAFPRHAHWARIGNLAATVAVGIHLTKIIAVMNASRTGTTTIILAIASNLAMTEVFRSSYFHDIVHVKKIYGFCSQHLVVKRVALT